MIPSSKFRINTLIFIIALIQTFHLIESFYNHELYSNNSESNELRPEDGTYNENDKECIGDRVEALDFGRQCSRRCKKDVPCENTRKQCLCDGLCGLSCIKPDLSCPDLLKIENGDFFPKTTRFNTKVVYQCDPGYYLFGSKERICQGDEEWSGAPAECLSEPSCRNPNKVNHARNPNDGNYRLNDKITYTCYPGYQSKGNPEAICKLVESNQTAWVWTGSPFKCIPKSCGDPGQIEHAKRHGESFTVASSVLYTCEDGFEMIGQARRYCQSDNQWSGQPPQCEPITCNPTDHLENGKINYVYPLVFNSTVEYACDYGFRLVGPQKRRCGPERTLVGDVPVCEEIDCGDIGSLYNGYIKGYSSRMGDKKEFTCMEGMKFVGDSQHSICLESGKWSHPVPNCLAQCIVPKVDHATGIYVIPPKFATQNLTNVTLKSISTGSQVSHGSFLEIFCEKEYELDEQMDENGLIQAPMCNNETWSYMPRCKPARCKSIPPSPKNGRVRVASFNHGSKGYIHCLDGYKLRGNTTTQCSKGNWTSIDSFCAEIYCGFPGIIEHGRVLLVGLTGMYDYKPYIRRISINRQIAYECENSYRLADGAPSGATCMDGQWKPEGLPACIKE